MTAETEIDGNDRASLKTLLDALDASEVTLKRDWVRGEGRTGDLGVRGTTDRAGNDANVIYRDGAGFLLYFTTDETDDREPSGRPWNLAKAKLGFCQVTQDGDWEGCLHLDHLPTAAEAETIREVLGIRKRRHLSDDARERASINLAVARSQVKTAKLDPPIDLAA